MASISKLNLIPYTLSQIQKNQAQKTQTPDIVLHNHFRSRSCIGTSMQFHIQCVASAYQLPPQDSAHIESDPQIFLLSCTPASLFENGNYSKAPNKRAGCAGLGAFSCTRWTRAHLVNMLLELPGDGCKRPDQTAVSGQQNAGSQERERYSRGNQETSWAICSCWSLSAPVNFHLSSKLASMLTPISPWDSIWRPSKASPWDPGSHEGWEKAILLWCDSAASQTPTDHSLHSLWQALSQSRAGVDLEREAGAAPTGLWALLQSESLSMVTELGIPAGNMMETDIKQTDANRCCNHQQGLAQGRQCSLT